MLVRRPAQVMVKEKIRLGKNVRKCLCWQRSKVEDRKWSCKKFTRSLVVAVSIQTLYRGAEMVIREYWVLVLGHDGEFDDWLFGGMDGSVVDAPILMSKRVAEETIIIFRDNAWEGYLPKARKVALVAPEEAATVKHAVEMYELIKSELNT